MSRKNGRRLARLLDSWPDLVDGIMDLKLDEVEALLEMERARDAPRGQFLTRIHQRLSRLRAQAERDRLMREAKR